ncbi:hypothetical protein HELRODRAFT_160608 [Helobdella robusta]|uniref:SHSP domain-containing protein n=1 Tax=Helobdella robusta TaxID=6412 RepID=T1EQH5_HELRO|nr:hypothetical protein HELRODRAFT_160608 [Helobdella robusta]ESO06439.1 hypothetical protein HELRODRAFT_160608 [Helobdella robusta]
MSLINNNDHCGLRTFQENVNSPEKLSYETINGCYQDDVPCFNNILTNECSNVERMNCNDFSVGKDIKNFQNTEEFNEYTREYIDTKEKVNNFSTVNAFFGNFSPKILNLSRQQFAKGTRSGRTDMTTSQGPFSCLVAGCDKIYLKKAHLKAHTLASNKKTSLPSSMSATSGMTGSLSSSEAIPIPLIHDSMTFENRQTKCIKEMERQAEQDLKRKKREWEREMEKMKEEFLKLHCGTVNELGSDPFVVKRKGSIEILDIKKMKTMITETPDSERRFRLRFDLSDFDVGTVKVMADMEKISVIAYKKNDENKTKKYWRHIAKPKEIDPHKLKSRITSDNVLILEALLHPKTLNLQKKTGPSPSHSFQGSRASSRSKSPPQNTPPSTPHREQPAKIGVPVFIQDDDGQRRMHLTVDVGNMFKPNDITVQVIKENRILIKAKNEERTSEKFTKMKYTKEIELAEKIESYSIRGGLTTDGKLIIGAFVKGYGGDLSKENAGNVIIEELKAPHSSLMLCNILNLASFPPTMPASAAHVQPNGT